MSIIIWIIMPLYAIIFVGFLLKIGKEKGILGLTVDERGKFSLSRLQALAWTFLISLAYLGISVNVGKFVDVPNNLITLMGVSLGSAVASQAIKTYKINTQKTVEEVPTDPIVLAAQPAPAVQPAKVIEPPKLIDLISEEERGYTSLLSLGKFQMLVWTIISLAVYLVILFHDFGSKAELPDVTSTMVTLMGISQGAYLVQKIPS
jgi:hypothetical protein